MTQTIINVTTNLSMNIISDLFIVHEHKLKQNDTKKKKKLVWPQATPKSIIIQTTKYHHSSKKNSVHKCLGFNCMQNLMADIIEYLT